MQNPESNNEIQVRRWPNRDMAIHSFNAASGAIAGPGVAGMRTQVTQLPRIEGTGEEAKEPPTIVSGGQSQSLSSLLHDTRNMIASMKLYCDLLDEPGVLMPRFRHYADDLRLVAAASERLLRRLTNLERAAAPRPLVPIRLRSMESSSDGPGTTLSSFAHEKCAAEKTDGGSPANEIDRFDGAAFMVPVQAAFRRVSSERRHHEPAIQIAQDGPRVRRSSLQSHPHRIYSLSSEIAANHKLVSAMVGPAITVGLSARGGSRPIDLNSDDLTRILINLASNSAQAMPEGGHIQITLEEDAEQTLLTFSDTGHGIPQAALNAVFEPGFSTRIDLHATVVLNADVWAAEPRGQGLSIVRSLVTLAGGSVTATGSSLARAIDEAKPGDETGGVSGPGAAIVMSFPAARSRPYWRRT